GRARRVAERFSDQMAVLFKPAVEVLGRALKVSEHAREVFGEAEIRRHLVFQLSKLSAFLSKRLRDRTGASVWDVLVPGTAAGRLRSTESLEALAKCPDPALISVLRKVDGDEEIPPNVRGIILFQPIPQLSHLGLRARQAGVVFVVCEEAEEFHRLAGFEAKPVVFKATSNDVSFELATGVGSASRCVRADSVRVPNVTLRAPRQVLALADVELQNGGAKAFGARRLEELSRRADAGFKTAPGLVIPFGIMEELMRSGPELETAYRATLYRLNESGIVERRPIEPGRQSSSLELPRSETSDFNEARERLQGLIGQITFPEEITRAVVDEFGTEARLMVRSSASCEDLDGFASAGLYDSIANVAPEEVGGAIKMVWASLWTRRAALSRQQAGLAHEKACMAVLIQRLVRPDYSFIMHTAHPAAPNSLECLAELAVGLGVILASAISAGSPYRMTCNRKTGASRMDVFANFSVGFQPGQRGTLSCQTLDYSRVTFSCDASFRQRIGAQLAAIAGRLEVEFRGPQDVEGIIVGDEIYLVQCRPQPGQKDECRR
ncbi:MAG: hypothetical protein M1608_10735, partial [Candidatus Omnitrophica bacterium]|nr:hypothetical protein [Candidatus Omnitrophota bacterium]